MEKELNLNIKTIFLLAIGFIGLSMFAWFWPEISAIITILIFVATLYLSSVNIKNGLLILFFEVFLGSLGKLFSTNTIFSFNLSVRLIIFIALILGTIIFLLKHASAQKLLINNLVNFKKTLLLIIAFTIIPTIIGVINNDLFSVYQDANAWIFFGLLLPCLAIDFTKQDLVNLFKILIGTSLATILLTTLLYVLYGWSLISQPIFTWLYHWLRQVGWGEVTHVNGNLYRIFSQAHVSILALWAICLSLLIKFPQQVINEKTNQLLLFITSLILIINLSRSMWVGAVCLVLYLIITNFKVFIKKLPSLIIIAVLTVLLSGLLIGRFGFITLASRASQQPTEPALASRIVQLKPLLNGIKSHWLTGTGFGGKVGYPSEDPRAKQKLDAQGLYWTSAFEWGYLDQLLKFGVIIFVAFAYFLFIIITNLNRKKDLDNFLVMAILITILATHIFSPYLNHPLGIIWLIIAIIVINTTKYNYEQSSRNH